MPSDNASSAVKKTELAVVPRPKSVLLDMSDRFGMDPAALEATLRATVFPREGTREDFAAFLMVARDYGLNPMTREIYAYPKKGGGIQPLVSIDGWIRLMNSHPQFDGIEYEETHDEDGKLVNITATIHRKDRAHPTRVTEWLSECIRGTDPWKMAHRMLRHRATVQCARIAFGFSGIMEQDEAAEMIDITPNTGPRPALPKSAPASAPTWRMLDAEGMEIGWWPPARWVVLLANEIGNADRGSVLAIYEHNAETLEQARAKGFDVSDIDAAYKRATEPEAEAEKGAKVKKRQKADAPSADPETGEVVVERQPGEEG